MPTQTMKVEVGYALVIYGTIEFTPEGLVFVGDSKELEGIARTMQQCFGWSDRELVEHLPDKLHHYLWARHPELEPSLEIVK